MRCTPLRPPLHAKQLPVLWQASQPTRSRLLKRLADTQDPLLADAPMLYYWPAFLLW